MNQWNVNVSLEFKQEIRDIYSYVANTLLAPKTALLLVGKIIDAVDALKEMPQRCPLYERNPWKKRGLRKLVVDNFVVFYFTNKKRNDVIVLHVFYGGRNIEELLM